MVDKIKQRGWKTILTVVTLLALVGMGYALRHQISETIQNVGRIHTWILLLMIPLEVLNYHSQTKLYQALFRLMSDKISYKHMFRIALELNFVNNIFPSGGVSGFSYFSLRMRSSGISAAKSTLAHLTKHILMFVSFQIMLILGLLMLAVDGRASGLLILVAGSLATLLVVGTMALAYIIGSKHRINSFFTFMTRMLNKVLQVFSKHPETINIQQAVNVFTELHDHYMKLRRNLRRLNKPLMYSLLANLTEVMVIYTVYLAFGHWVNPGAVIIAYAVANFAGLVSVLPGGVGIYEALMTAVLAAGGVPPSLSLPVTVMYRVLNMSIQLPPGYYFYHKAINAKTGDGLDNV